MHSPPRFHVRMQVLVNGEVMAERGKDVQDVDGAMLELTAMSRRLATDLTGHGASGRTSRVEERSGGYSTGGAAAARYDQVKAAAHDALLEAESFFIVTVNPDGTSEHSCGIKEDDGSPGAFAVLHFAREESTKLLKAALRDQEDE